MESAASEYKPKGTDTMAFQEHIKWASQYVRQHFQNLDESGLHGSDGYRLCYLAKSRFWTLREESQEHANQTKSLTPCFRVCFRYVFVSMYHQVLVSGCWYAEHAETPRLCPNCAKPQISSTVGCTQHVKGSPPLWVVAGLWLLELCVLPLNAG